MRLWYADGGLIPGGYAMSESIESPKERRWGRGTVPILLAVAVLIGCFAPRLWWKWQLGRELAELAEEGNAIDLATHLAQNSVPAGEVNAADLLAEPLEALRAALDGPGSSELSDILRAVFVENAEETFTPELAERVRIFLEPIQPLLAQIRAGGRFPHAAWPHDEIPTYSAYLGQLLLANRILRIEALLAASEENTQAAVDELASAVMLMGTLRGDLLLQSNHLYASGVAQTARDGLRMLHWGALGEAHLAQLEQVLGDVEPLENLRGALLGQCLIGMSWLRETPGWEIVFGEQFTYHSWGDTGLVGVMMAGGFRDGACLELVRGYRSLSNAWMDPGQPFKHQNTTRSGLGEYLPDLQGGRSVLSDLERTSEWLVMALTELRMIRIIFALERFRLAHVALPDSLDTLAPLYLREIPLDPWSAEPFHYRREGRDYVLYSVGPDNTDDGGNSAEPWAWYTRSQRQGGGHDYTYSTRMADSENETL